MKKTVILVMVMILVMTSFNNEAYAITNYQQGIIYLNAGKTKEAIKEFTLAVASGEQAAYLRKLAEAYEADGQFQKASETYYLEADLYLKKGLMDEYVVEKSKGDALSTDIQLFVETSKSQASTYTLGKYEPANGVYIGAFVEYDSNVGPRNVAKFNEITGKQHAVYYTYHEYGSTFPYNWAAQVKEAGAAVHLSLEPNKGLDIVKDDAYIHEFARMAKEAEVPIFLRFASEMNGNWVKWNGNPALYIEKFRLVHDILAKEAPNVAMVWAPNALPEKEITKYYPGDKWVDWVGVNLYSVSIFNGDPKQPADQVNPLDLLDFIYKEYSDRKPIQVAEYAATNYSFPENKDKTQFAITKMNMLYHGIKLLYPRVKAINWYSVNNGTHAHSVERQLNNFSLTENPKVLAAYKTLIQDPYYLSEVVNGPFAKSETKTKSTLQNLSTNNLVTSNGTLFAWVKTYDPYISKVVQKIDGVTVGTAIQYPFKVTLDMSKLSTGKHTVETIIFDSLNREASRKTSVFYAKEKLAVDPMILKLNSPKVQIGEEEIILSASPFTLKSSTMVPLRFISENLGATVAWDSQLKKITITKGVTTISLWENKLEVLVDGIKKSVEAPPTIKKGTTFVPLRFVSEQLGGQVSYNPSDKTVSIMTK